jgi:hypothetical protein
MATWLVKNWKLAIVWALSLIAVSAISGSAQTLPTFLHMENETVVSRDDIGFGIERTQDGNPVGQVVVRPTDSGWIPQHLRRSSGHGRVEPRPALATHPPSGAVRAGVLARQ